MTAAAVLGIINSLPDRMLAVAADGTIVAANSSTADLFGMPRQALLDEALSTFLADHPDVSARFLQRSRRRRCEHGSRRGSLPRSAGTHELKQPLRAAAANGTTCQHWLSDEAFNLERARRAAQRMIAAVRRASEVIDRIHALLNNTALERTRLAINDLLRETLALLDGELGERQVVADLGLAEPSPSVIGDRVQLQQVVVNLIMNSIEAMVGIHDRPRRLQIRSHAGDDDNILVAVEDSGIGLDPAIVERMFDPFYTTKSGGMGMGLSICRSIIENHGGRLWAAPAAVHGAVVQFTLPADGTAIASNPS